MLTELFRRAKSRGVSLNTLIALEGFEDAIESNPDDSVAYARFGGHWRSEKEYEKALFYFDISLELDPDDPWTLGSRSYLLATCPNDEIRDASLALYDALGAFSIANASNMFTGDWIQRGFHRMLAAAYAEYGDFDKAIEIETAALEFAITKSARYRINEHLAKYRNKEPIRSEGSFCS